MMEEIPGVVTDGGLLPDSARALRPRTFLTPGFPGEHGADRPGDRPGRNACQRGRVRTESCASRAGDGFAHPPTDREGGEPSRDHSRPQDDRLSYTIHRVD